MSWETGARRPKSEDGREQGPDIDAGDRREELWVMSWELGDRRPKSEDGREQGPDIEEGDRQEKTEESKVLTRRRRSSGEVMGYELGVGRRETGDGRWKELWVMN